MGRAGGVVAAPVADPHVAGALDYARRVVDGEILACKWVRLACERHLSDLKRARGKDYPYRFDPERAERVCRFVELLPHTKGKWAARKKGQPRANLIRLEPWQAFITCVLFGWVAKAKNVEGKHVRRFRTAYIAVPRKNGKSSMVAPLGLYMLAADAEPGAEVYCGATSKDQAWEVFRPAKMMAESVEAEGLRRHYGVEVAAESIYRPSDSSRFRPLIGKPGDGASPSCAIIDEYHEHPDDTQYDTMRTGMGAREQPMCIVITTAGEDVASPCYALQQDIEKILTGVFQDEETFGIVWTIDEGMDWSSEEALRMANPNYGVSVNPEQLKGLQQEALRSPRKQNVFKTKRLNVWVHARNPWMNMEAWNRAADSSLHPDQFAGDRAWMAMDLSSKLDVTSVVRLFWKDDGEETCRRCAGLKTVEIDGESVVCVRCAGLGVVAQRHYFAFARHYLPEEQANLAENPHYQGWVIDGKLIPTDGNVIDYDRIKDDVLADAKRMELVGLGFDPWNAMATALQLGAEGINVVEVPQTVRNLSEPMKEIEALVLSDRFHHDGDPVLTWMVSNVVAKEDAKGNLFPRKQNPKAKIDGAVALLTAMARALVDQGENTTSVYETRGVRVF